MKNYRITVNGTSYDVTVEELSGGVAPAAAPVATPSASAQNEDEVVAAIVGAIVAMGYSSEQIASIRPTATSAKWRLEGRLSGRG